MQLKPLEYVVNKHMGDETITITKKALEEWRDHYNKIAQGFKNKDKPCYFGFYLGKSDALTEILKHFDNE